MLGIAGDAGNVGLLNLGTVPTLRPYIEVSRFVRGAYSTVPYVAPQPWAASAELIWSHRRVRS